MKNPPEILLGFDFGTKRIGVAIGQMITQTARALTVLSAKNGVPDWKAVQKLIKLWQPDALVVGIPLNMDGTEQPLTSLAKNFAQILEQRFELRVHEMDERLSTVEARARIFDEGGYKALKNNPVDSTAAKIILENWLAIQPNS